MAATAPHAPFRRGNRTSPASLAHRAKRRAIEHADTDINPARRELKQSKRARIEQTEYTILGHNSGLKL
jgi:hypothetical protein